MSQLGTNSNSLAVIKQVDPAINLLDKTLYEVNITKDYKLSVSKEDKYSKDGELIDAKLFREDKRDLVENINDLILIDSSGKSKIRGKFTKDQRFTIIQWFYNFIYTIANDYKLLNSIPYRSIYYPSSYESRVINHALIRRIKVEEFLNMIDINENSYVNIKAIIDHLNYLTGYKTAHLLNSLSELQLVCDKRATVESTQDFLFKFDQVEKEYKMMDELNGLKKYPRLYPTPMITEWFLSHLDGEFIPLRNELLRKYTVNELPDWKIFKQMVLNKALNVQDHTKYFEKHNNKSNMKQKRRAHEFKCFNCGKANYVK